MHVFIHVDADPDHSSAYSMNVMSPTRVPRENIRWHGLLATLDYFRNISEKLEKLGFTFRSTFFLRADEQINRLCGTYAETFVEFYDKITRFFSVGWHPHLYRWSEGFQCWYQEYKDAEWASRVLTDSYKDLKSHGFSVRFSKMGWCFHNNATMKTLSDIGIAADFSAAPGFKSPGYLEPGRSFQNKADWSKTCTRPYHPCESNYQQHGGLKILEIPQTTYELGGPIVLLYTMKLALKSYVSFDFSYFPSFRVRSPLLLANLVKREDFEEIRKLIKKWRKEHYVTMYLHPEDMLDVNNRLVFEEFIHRLISMVSEYDIKISFVDALGLYDRVRAWSI